jgi:hypothetical protein
MAPGIPTGTNLADAELVVNAIAQDLQGSAPQQQEQEQQPQPRQPDLLGLLEERGVNVFSFGDWLHLDASEIERGALSGKPREKCVSTRQMLKN